MDHPRSGAGRAEAVVVVRRGVVVVSGAGQSQALSTSTLRRLRPAPSLTARSRRPPEPSRATTVCRHILVVSELTGDLPGVPRRTVAAGGSSAPSTEVIWKRRGEHPGNRRRIRVRQADASADGAWAAPTRRAMVVFDGTYDVGALAPTRCWLPPGSSRCSKTHTAAWIPCTRCFVPSRSRYASITSVTAGSARGA